MLETPDAPMQVHSLARAIEVLQGSALDVADTQCVNLRGRVESCHRCAEACHAGALTLGTDEISVDESSCSACGACVPACPAGVFSLSGFNPRRFLQSLDGEATVHLHCSESKTPGGGVVIPCFKLLDARLLASACAEGTREFHLHGAQHCADCKRGGSVEHLYDVASTLDIWLGERSPSLRITDAKAPAGADIRRRQDQPVLSRRALLRIAGQQGASRAANWMLPVAEEELDAVEVPSCFFTDVDEQHAEPYQALLAERVSSVPWSPNAPLPWQTRGLTEECSACLACAQRCPTGALIADESENHRGITYHTALCTDCGLCQQVCPHGAVDSSPAVSLTEITAGRRSLMHRETRYCESCGQACFPDEMQDATCQQCANEQRMDDEWLSMLNG